MCGLNFTHPIYFCENVRTFLLGYDVISTAGLVIDTESRNVWSKFTATWASAHSFATPTDIVSVDPSTTTSTTVDAVTTTSFDSGMPPCESLRLSRDYLVTTSPTTTITDLGDSARALAHSAPTSHCNGASTVLDPSTPTFTPRSHVTTSSRPLHSPTCCCQLGHSTFAAHVVETPYLSIAVENLDILTQI